MGGDYICHIFQQIPLEALDVVLFGPRASGSRSVEMVKESIHLHHPEVLAGSRQRLVFTVTPSSSFHISLSPLSASLPNVEGHLLFMISDFTPHLSCHTHVMQQQHVHTTTCPG